MANLLIFGCGYTGLRIARDWQAKDGGKVYGTTRNRAKSLSEQNITPLDLSNEAHILSAIKSARAIVISTPPPDAALPYAKAIAASNAWLAYLSTTAVYGDAQGDWVDETTKPNPGSKRGQARLETEQSWQSFAPRVNIFRLAGIYGVGRGPYEKIRSGRAQKIIKQGQVFGRIHVDDIARIVLASYQKNDAGEVFNLTDDRPVAPEIVLDYAAKKLGVPALEPVAIEDARLSEMARSFYSETKRVRNDKIRAHFGKLLYPDYQSGLDAISKDEIASHPSTIERDE